MDNEFKDIILKLEKLNEVKADKKLVNRFENLLIPSLQKRTYFSALLQFKFVPILFLFLAIGSTLVIASENSQPGEILYPVKAAVFRIRPQASILPTSTPTPLPAASVLPSPSQSPEVKGQSVQVHINPQAVANPSPMSSVSVSISGSAIATPTPSPSTTPTSTPQANLEVQLPVASATISVGAQLPEVTKEPLLNLDVSLNDKKIINIGL